MLGSKREVGSLTLPPFTFVLNVFFLVSIYVFNLNFRWDMKQGIYFVFGTFSLLGISLFMRPKRQLKNMWLGLFLLWSLFNVFLHNFFTDSSLIQKYINFCLMSEGFIYVLCGILLYKLIYEYGEDKLRFYPALWLALGWWLIRAISIKSVSPILALLVCFSGYALCKKRWILLISLANISAVLLVRYWNYIWLKWEIRPEVWAYTIGEIIKHPFGYGFDNGIMNNLILTSQGWAYRHNDFLNITRDLGIVALLIIVCDLGQFFRKVKIDWFAICCLSVILLCLGQTTWYFTKNAVLFIPLFALCEIHSKQTKNGTKDVLRNS